MMKTDMEMYINVSAGGTRIALTETGKLVELHIERADYDRMVGNIYKGKIQNVIPGMQAAFIDIGHEINSFLPFSEIGNIRSIFFPFKLIKQSNPSSNSLLISSFSGFHNRPSWLGFLTIGITW